MATKVIRILDFAPSLEEDRDIRSGSFASVAESRNEDVTILGTLRSLSGEPDFSDDESMVANAETDG